MDAYDHMVAYLTERPGEIYHAWKGASSHVAGRLFAFVSPSRNSVRHPDGRGECGCLTTIRFGDTLADRAWTDALEIAIKGDERIPVSVYRITPDHLPIFAGWQRRIDKILNRTPPVWNGPPFAKPEVEMRAAPVWTPPEPDQ